MWTLLPEAVVYHMTVMDISMDMATAAASQYLSDGVVCPLIFRNGIFTTAAVDNIDHNPSSNTAQDAFHGTGISLFQNREEESDGVQRERAILPCLQPGISNKKIPQLPESYTNLTPVTARKKDPAVPMTTGRLISDSSLLYAALEDEKKRQKSTQRLVRQEVQSIDDPIAWAAFHSSALSCILYICYFFFICIGGF